MKRKESGLSRKARGHESNRQPRAKFGSQFAGQQSDVQCPIIGVNQDGTEQIHHRPEQGKKQVAQRGDQRRGASGQANQRDPSEGEQLKRDVEVE